MIHIERDPMDHASMRIDLKGNAEEIAQEYVALTLGLNDEYPIILKRAQWYLEDGHSLRIMREEDKK